MRSTSWCGDCSRSLPAAGAVFVSLSTFSKHLFVQIDTYLVRSNLTNCHVRTWVGEHVGCCPSDLGVRPRMESRMIFLFFLCHIYFLFFVPECEICTVVMIEASSEQSKSLFYMQCCCRCCCSVCSYYWQLLWFLLLLRRDRVWFQNRVTGPVSY